MKFFLGGRLIFGPDVRSVALTLFLILSPVAVFCKYVAIDLQEELPWGISVMSVALVLTFCDLVVLFLTSGRDPGIIPRNTHPPEPEYDSCATPPVEYSSERTPRLQMPRTKDVIVNGVAVKVKYCYTCMLYRSPRCSHCSVCNNCVERFDHHCPWVGQCIGQRNYRFFFMFVCSSTVLCTYVFVFCLLDIIEYNIHNHCNVVCAIRGRIAAFVLLFYTFVAFWFVGGLTVFHFYLISTNQTTYENFRSRYDSKVNPYNQGFLSNFREVFFTKIPPSRHNFHEKVQVDSTKHGGSDPNVCRHNISPNTGKRDIDLEKGDMITLPAVCTEALEDLRACNSDNNGLGLESIDGYGDSLAHALGDTLLSSFREFVFAKIPPSESDFHEKVQEDSARNSVSDPNVSGKITSPNTGKGDVNLEAGDTTTLAAI